MRDFDPEITQRIEDGSPDYGEFDPLPDAAALAPEHTVEEDVDDNPYATARESDNTDQAFADDELLRSALAGEGAMPRESDTGGDGAAWPEMVANAQAILQTGGRVRIPGLGVVAASLETPTLTAIANAAVVIQHVENSGEVLTAAHQVITTELGQDTSQISPQTAACLLWGVGLIRVGEAALQAPEGTAGFAELARGVLVNLGRALAGTQSEGTPHPEIVRLRAVYERMRTNPYAGTEQEGLFLTNIAIEAAHAIRADQAAATVEDETGIERAKPIQREPAFAFVEDLARDSRDLAAELNAELGKTPQQMDMPTIVRQLITLVEKDNMGDADAQLALGNAAHPGLLHAAMEAGVVEWLYEHSAEIARGNVSPEVAVCIAELPGILRTANALGAHRITMARRLEAVLADAAFRHFGYSSHIEVTPGVMPAYYRTLTSHYRPLPGSRSQPTTLRLADLVGKPATRYLMVAFVNRLVAANISGLAESNRGILDTYRATLATRLAIAKEAKETAERDAARSRSEGRDGQRSPAARTVMGFLAWLDIVINHGGNRTNPPPLRWGRRRT